MQKLRFRLATPADFGALDAIRAAAFAPVFASFRTLVGPGIAAVAFRDAELEQQDHLRSILTPCEGRAVLVAIVNGRAAGFCAFTWNTTTSIGEIGLNAVHPAAQRQRVAARLYDAALERMRAEGMKVATVGTGGDDSHAPARAAYEKSGFVAAVPSLHLYRLL